ncbi:TPA: hypothetical protein HA338_00815 [Methanosarcina acetivorans]|uniref:Uncharacterized protein n=1 Tax=Methanosarcina acetivorans TaxID=2214 RepID=A0A832W701_9EURY|nr:hypothetical protein [Methanosarcina acetivorans]HIH92628.1 hypothetical protein [Methanosarcina acetivorans]
MRKRKFGRETENYNKWIIKSHSEILPAENGKKGLQRERKLLKMGKGLQRERKLLKKKK